MVLTSVALRSICSALRAVGGVGHGEDDGPLVALSHGPQHIWGEQGPRPRQPYQYAGLHLQPGKKAGDQ